MLLVLFSPCFNRSGDDCDKACSHCEYIMTAVIQQDPGVIQQDPAVIQQDPSTAGLVAAIYTVGIFLELCRSVKGQRNRASMDKVHDFVARNIHPQLDMLLQNVSLNSKPVFHQKRRSHGYFLHTQPKKSCTNNMKCTWPTRIKPSRTQRELYSTGSRWGLC